MARINVEKSWWEDRRRMDLALLLGSAELADGVMLSAWKLSQEYWARGRQTVPKDEFMLLKHAEKIIQVGLCEVRNDYVYIRGARENHEWLALRRESGSAGGSAKSRNHSGSALAIATISTRDPSLSTLLSSSLKKTTKKEAQTSSALDTHQLVQEPKKKEAYEPEFLKAYEKYPLKKGKNRAHKIFMREALDQEDNLKSILAAIDRYTADLIKNRTEPKFIKHFDSFLSSWRDWTDDDAGSVNIRRNERRGILIGEPDEE